MNKFELILAGIGTALQIGLFVLLLARQSYREFPFFFSYTAVATLNAILTMTIRNNGRVYFRVYWTYEVLYIILAFLVLQEAVRSVFRNFYGLPWFKLLFPTIGVLMILVAILRHIFLQKVERHPIMGALIALEIAIGFLQFGLFCLFIILVRFFHMRWRERAFGIILGFGIVAGGLLVAFLPRSEFGTNLDAMVRIVTPLSYIIGVTVWLATFLQPQPSVAANGEGIPFTPEQMITELRRHTKAVKGILRR